MKRHERSFTVFPQHTNMHYPMVFGGIMMGEMDLTAAECVRKVLLENSKDYLSAVTVAVNNIVFYVGAEVGDMIRFEAEVVKLGIKRIELHVEGYRLLPNSRIEHICKGDFVFVTKDNPHASKGIAHGLKLDWN